MVDDNAVHGLQLAPEPSHILQSRPAPHAPIRTINAHQLAELVHQYNTADVEDSILFPFLHGLEGNNAAQNSFFNHARRGGRAHVPRYRGLILVRVDEQGFELDVRGNLRNPSHSAPASGDDEDADSLDGLSDDDDQCAMAVESTFMHPVAERTRQTPHQLNTQNVSPLPSSESASMNSASTESMSIANYFASPSNSAVSLSQTSPPTTPNSTTDAFKPPFPAHADSGLGLGAASATEDHDQVHRNRTPVPPAHDAPRRPSHVLTCSFHPDEILTQSASGPAFVNPRIPDGISLRNFGIQVPIYATLSDVVVYSPKGKTKAALALAERCKQAIEAKAVERGFVVPAKDGGEPTMSPLGVVYNVYVLTDTFEAFEKQYPHLVWIDSKGDSVQKIEFMEREKEEMRNLTRASEISEGVYLGNTADVPLVSNPPTPIASPNSAIPVYPGFDPFDPSNNPEGYDICIECHDMAAFPNKGMLAGVEERLRALDEQWRQRVRDAQFLRDQERENEQRRQQELARKEELRKRREAEMDLDMDLDTDDGKEPDVKVIDDGLGLRLDMPRLSPPAQPGQLTNGVPLSPKSNDLFNNLSLSNGGSAEGTPKPGGSTPIPVPASQQGHGRSRSIGASLSSLSSFSQSPIGTPSRKGSRSYPPRPPPNATQVIHLAFPSSPPATPQTVGNIIPFLQFLHNLTHPRPPSADELSWNSGSLGRSANLPGGGRARSPSLSSTGSSPGQPLRTSMSHSRSGSLTALSPRTRSQTVGFSGMSPSARGSVRSVQPGIQLTRPMKILLHAGDGYTETSVLALSYLMLAGNKTLPEAYLELQVQKARSFFVYSIDVGVLRRVEQKLKLERERERERMAASIAATAASVGSSSPKDGSVRSTSPPPAASNRWRWGVPTSWRSGSLSSAGVSLLSGSGMFSTPHASATNALASEEQRQTIFATPADVDKPTAASVPTNGMVMSASDPALPALAASPALPSELVAENSPSAPPQASSSHQRVVPSQRPPSLSQSYGPGQVVPMRRARASTSPLLPSFLDHETWFNDPKFDGSFPSRVLPFLYLGNLAHAGNAYMLHALGITHVVSVGECALIPPQGDACTTYGHNQSGSYSMTASTTGGPFMQGRPGNGSLWVEEKEGRIRVLDIKGVCDDGIDSLRPQILPTVEWIDKARAEGGKVLVHCRVGVSRSATVTIAYVMHHLKCSLVDAYLMVRSRRLSVLIQPNMRLLYNLCGWEIELARRRAQAEGRDLSLDQGRSLSWPFLAREVHILNERYLS